jgi:hypothetical protein
MTISGMNVGFKVYRISTPSDDYSGGALTSGSVAYDFINARFEQQPATQQFLEQGLEVVHLFKVTAIPGTMDIRERDELELIKPTDHWEYQNFFRVIDVHHANHNPRDPRNYLMMTVTRSERAHDIQTR